MSKAEFNRNATVDEIIPDPDLLLIVKRLTQGQDEVLTYSARAREPSLGLSFAEETTEPFGLSPTKVVADLYRDIEGLGTDAASDAALETAQQTTADEVREHLADQGAYLCRKLMPPKLRRRLWQIRDRVTTVQIFSRELWIPWELLRLEDPENPTRGGFLAEIFALTLWILERSAQSGEEEESHPAAVLPLRRLAVIAPGDTRLPHLDRERQHLLDRDGEVLADDGRRQVVEVPARRRDVKAAFHERFDGWHFSGHGLAVENSSDRSFLVLENGERLDPMALRPGILARHRPLVFLNACQSAWGDAALTGVGGLAQAFLKAGAGAFIGSHWRISDHQASELTGFFYENLLGWQLPIGEAMRQARLELRRRHPADPTWLAYSVYAHPLASCRPALDEEENRPDSPPPRTDGVPPATPRPEAPLRRKPGKALPRPGREWRRPAALALVVTLALAGILALGQLILSGDSASAGKRPLRSYQITVLVVDEQGRFVEEAELRTSQGEIVRTPRAWEIRIPDATTTALRLEAAKPNAFLEGGLEVELGDDAEPTFEIVLRREEVEVYGIVVDMEGRAVAGARVTVVGFPDESVVTDESGHFKLPAHAADGQSLRLRAEKGDDLTDLPARAGRHPITLVLDGS